MTEAIILAGGLGTRLRSRVSDRPKPMAEVAGRPFLEHLLFYYANQGAKHFVISVGYKGNIIKDHFGDSFKNIAITYVFEDKPLGTGGAILKSFESLKSNEPFLLLNGDAIFRFNLKSIYKNHCKKNLGATFISGEFTYAYGTIGVKNNKIINFKRNLVFESLNIRNDEKYHAFNYTGMSIVKTELLRRS